MLGSTLAAKADGQGYNTLVFDLPDSDITNKNHIKEIVSSADVIVNCAAYTAVDKAEKEPDKALRVNAEAVGRLAVEATKKGRYIIHISTDFVFGDLKKTPQSETDAPNPLNVYGKTKLEGEKLLLKSAPDSSIIRVQWTYGNNGNNFVCKMISLAEKLPNLKVVEDQSGSPTSVSDVSDAILCFLRKRPRGLFLFAASGYTTRFETARLIFDELKIDKPLSPCLSEEFATSARRPLNSRFDCSKIDALLDFKRPCWDEALRDFIRKGIK